MRLLHLSDLHLGKKIFGFDLLTDQKFVLKQIKKYIVEHRPDALIIAGDIYDRTTPPAEAIALFDQFLSEVLLQLHTPVLAVAGNHDGAELIGYGRELLSKVQLYMEGRFTRTVRKVTLHDADGGVDFYLLPFAEYQTVRDVLEQNEIQSADQAMQAIMETIQKDLNPQHRNVLITHGYIGGGTPPEICDSEKPLSIGGKSWVSSEHLEIFDYVALGHLHKAQSVGSDKIRYAGSPLKYSFSEEHHKKTVTLVDIDADGIPSIELLPLNCLHDLRTLKGEFADLLHNVRTPMQDCYLQVVLTDTGELYEPKRQLDKVYPYIMLFGMEQRLKEIRSLQENSALRKHKEPTEMLEEFYTFCTDGTMSELERELLVRTMEEL